MKDLVYSLLAVLYPHGLFQKFAYFLNVILSYKIASKLESCGNGTRFSKVEFSTGLSKICVGSNTVLLPPLKRSIVSKGPIVIGDNVWIGDKVTILSGVTIGNNSVIAANTVVTKDVPAFSIVAGNPGKVIKKNGENKNE